MNYPVEFGRKEKIQSSTDNWIIREGMNDLIYRKTNIDESTIDKVPIWEKCTLTIDEAAEFSNIGKNKLSELLKRPRCPFVLYVGKKKLVKRKEFLEFISRNNEI